MTRQEYLSALRNALKGLAKEERDAALRYYEEYFDEAESEEEAISQLGSPEDIAGKLLSENAKEAGKEAAKEARKKKYPPSFWWGIGILCVFASPLLIAVGSVALSLAVTAVALVLSLVCAVLAPFASLTMAFLGCFLFFFYLAFGAIGVFTPGSLVLAGCGMLFGSLSILCGIFTGYLVYWIYLLFKLIFTSIFRRKGGVSA